MRICQLTHVETAFGFLGPVFTALAADGHEVVAACTLDRDGLLLRRYLGAGVPIHRVTVSRSITATTFSSEILDLARYLARERFDVLHLHGPLPAVQGRLAARLARVPVVISHAHGFYFHDRMRRLPRSAHVTIELVLGRLLTDHIITVNEQDMRIARRFTSDPARVVATPGVGVDPQRFAPLGSPVGRTIRRELGVGDDELVVTFVGRLVEEKGVLDLASAFSGLLADGPARLLLVGDTSPTERDQDTLRRLGDVQRDDPGSARATLRLGHRRDIPEILAATDVFVLPSHREGMPVSLLEAMACEVPVVTTDIRGCREAVAGGTAGVLVPAGDPVVLAEALRKLGADPDERRRLGAAGRAEVLARRTTAHGVAPVVALYRRIAASRTTAPLRPVRRLGRRVLPAAVRARLAGSPRWRIAVEHVAHPADPVAADTTMVLSDASLAELGLAFVADPFAVARDGTWHLFFEQVAIGATRGEIGLATSTDLRSWTYRGAVLAEPFHLSYPHVVEADGEAYLIPEASGADAVRRYRAVEFPHRWELCDVLLAGRPFKDSTVLAHEGAYYLLSETSAGHTHDELRLYVSEQLGGPWTEHPASPLVLGNADAARPAGGLLSVDGRPLRLAQRCGRRYGEAVHGHLIDVLTPTEYRESPPSEVMVPRANRWNARATHHLDAHQVPGGWIRFVDGCR